MNQPDLKKMPLRPLVARLRLWPVVLIILALASNWGFGDEASEASLTKYQVEAVFLYNFAKYVNWPDTVFPDATTPITIGVLGTDPFGDNLQRIVEGKVIYGRTFIIRHLADDADVRGCEILFISDSETARMEKILEPAAALPILTVGEDESFAQNNGIIDFVLKDDKVRLEINLAAARKAGLTISSKLLAVADSVKGKAR